MPMWAILAVIAAALAIVIKLFGNAPTVVTYCILFWLLFIALHLAWPLTPWRRVT